MLRSQEKQLRASEIRQRLNELAGKDTLTAEERAEVDTLSAELATVETQYRAAVRAEETEARDHRAAGDGEGAERRALERDVQLGRYLQAAVESRAVDGRESELNAALGLGAAGLVPWEALAPREDRAAGDVEQRQDVATEAPATGNPVNQASILSRVFARTAAAYLRVDMPAVGVGEASYPVFTSGTTAETVAKGAAHDAAAATFTANVLTPRRLTARYLWNVEDAAVLAGLESALRSDLSMVMGDQLDQALLTDDGTAPKVKGFLDAAGPLAARTTSTPAWVNDDEMATFNDFTMLYTGEVDGIYAQEASEVRALVAPALYQKAAVTYRTDESDESALMHVRRIGGGFRVSAHMPDPLRVSEVPASNPKKDDNVYEQALVCRGMARAAVAPIWQGLRLIRDEITLAGKGQIVMTAMMLYAFDVLRADQYGVRKLRVANVPAA